jgi:hypothetical protein
VRFARENEERGLERVVRVGGVREHPATGGEHHRPVPPHQFGERLFGARVEERAEQLRVRIRWRRGDGANERERGTRHELASVGSPGESARRRVGASR